MVNRRPITAADVKAAVDRIPPETREAYASMHDRLVKALESRRPHEPFPPRELFAEGSPEQQVHDALQAGDIEALLKIDPAQFCEKPTGCFSYTPTPKDKDKPA